MLPGFSAALMMRDSELVYAVNTVEATPWETLGSLADARIFRIIVAPGVIVSSSDAGTPAMSLNFPAGSTVYLHNLGEIAGAGGAGGGGDRGSQQSGNATNFGGGGGGGGTGRVGGAGGAAAATSSATAGSAGTSGTPGSAGTNDLMAGSGGFTPGAVPVVGGDAIEVTTAITLYIVNSAGLIVAGGSGGRGGYQVGSLPGGARDPDDGYGPPAGITATAVESGWAIKLASGATVVPVSGVNSTNVKGAYAGPTSS